VLLALSDRPYAIFKSKRKSRRKSRRSERGSEGKSKL
jgi:hypothetical protein